MEATRTRVRNPGEAEAPAQKEIKRSIVVKLDVPISLGGVQTSTLTLRRPSVGDRLMVAREHGGKSPDEQDAIFLAHLCDLAPDEFERVDMVDFGKLSDALRSFSNSAP